MIARELREKNPDELRKLLLELRREQFNLRMQSGSGQTIRPNQWGRVRREVARIKTVLTQLEQSH
ncbi:MAG: 50S ribosomal protein L29 [Gammaproteobacteria bacterium]